MNTFGRRLWLKRARYSGRSIRAVHATHSVVDSMLRASEKSFDLRDGAIAKVEISQLGANK